MIEPLVGFGVGLVLSVLVTVKRNTFYALLLPPFWGPHFDIIRRGTVFCTHGHPGHPHLHSLGTVMLLVAVIRHFLVYLFCPF